jgi:hypothetical protein
MDFSNFAWREIKSYMMDKRWSIDKEVDKMLQEPTDELSNILYKFGMCVKLGQFDQARQTIEDGNKLVDILVEESTGLRQWECPSDREGWIDEEDQARYDALQEKINSWFYNLEKLILMVGYKEHGFDWVTTGEPKI